LTKRSEILKIFGQNGGIIKLNEVTKLGINKYHLLKLIETGEVEKSHHGLYKLIDCQLNDYVELKKHVPSGIICLFSAWNYYGLTTYVPHEFHVAIEKKSKIRLPDFPPIKLYYWSNPILLIGKATIEIENIQVDIYDLEKSICDVVKFRNKVGKDILNEVLNEYLKRKDRNLEKLIQYAKQLRVEKAIKNYLDVLL
jgi:predicted transcriptional regulator of viral defense system